MSELLWFVVGGLMVAVLRTRVSQDKFLRILIAICACSFVIKGLMIPFEDHALIRGMVYLTVAWISVALWGLCTSFVSARRGAHLFTLFYFGVAGVLLVGVQIFLQVRPVATLYRSDPTKGYVMRTGVPMKIPGDPRDGFCSSYISNEEDAGYRSFPANPLDPRMKVMTLGCSYTFGFPVEVDHAYPEVAKRLLWPKVAIINRAIAGWGPVQGLIALRERIDLDKPDVVFYVWIANHLPRASIRYSYLRDRVTADGLSRFPVPVFFLNKGNGLLVPSMVTASEDGELCFFGAKPAESLLAASLTPSSKELNETEMETSIALLKEMDRECRTRNVLFRVLILPERCETPYFVNQELTRMLTTLDIESYTLDEPPDRFLVDGKWQLAPLAYYKVDGHPTPRWHKHIGEQFAKVLKLLMEKIERLGRR